MLKDLIAAETVTPEKCAGCGIPIRDRYYLLVADRAWHNQCLRCCKCLANLETELSCYAREGNIYCKDDYYRNFSSRRCARCGSGINASELVMRAKDLIFHVNCFSCAICGQLLRGGDTAGIREGRLFCGEHYDTDVLSEPETISSQFYPGGGGGTPGRGGAESGDGPAELQPLQPHQQQQQHSQKGRPRKRKPIAQLLDGGQQQGSLQNQPPPQPHDGLDPGTPLRLDLLHKELSVSSLDLSSYDGSQSPGSGGTLTPNCRTKRMRTSFKHHQLRTMKSYFAINQNPDAKDLKQLAQKTGLSKRVNDFNFPGLVPERPRQVATERDASGGQPDEPGRPTTGQPTFDHDRKPSPPPSSFYQCHVRRRWRWRRWQQSEQYEQQRRRSVLESSPGGNAQHDLCRAVLTQSDDQEYDPVECDQTVPEPEPAAAPARSRRIVATS